MRVISGLRKGHKLKSPRGMNVRPTEDRIKESLFSIIGPIGENSIVLDAFGGSGSIGIEFLSRGARLCYFVDNSMDSINIIKENLIHTKFLEESIVEKKDINLAIRSYESKKILFDYIYLDPPFRQGDFIQNLITNIYDKNILNIDGTIIVEHEKELILEQTIKEFYKYDFRNYGSKSLSFYRIKAKEEV